MCKRHADTLSTLLELKQKQLLVKAADIVADASAGKHGDGKRAEENHQNVNNALTTDGSGNIVVMESPSKAGTRGGTW